jgi:hypothetical protein
MRICGSCENTLEGKRSDAKFCSPACKQRGRRKRVAAAAADRQRTLTPEGRRLVDNLAAVLPATAGRVENFILQNGADCTKAAVGLVLSAYSEARQLAAF